MGRRFQLTTCLLAAAFTAALSSGANALVHPKQIQHRGKSDKAAKPHRADKTAKPQKAAETRHPGKDKKAALKKGGKTKHAAAARKSKKSDDETPKTPPAPALTGDLAAVKNAIDLARKAKTDEATTIQQTIADPAGKKLAEWFILRHPDANAKFIRFAAFIADNPDWPGMALMRRRAEARLWQEQISATVVRWFTADRPTSTKGRLALARALMSEGDRDGAARWAREAWRKDEMTEATEAAAFETFRDLLKPEDHRARMDKRIGAKDLAGAKRAAQRLGGDELAIVKACAAVAGSSSKALDLLDEVGTEARKDLGYTLCRFRWLARKDKIEDATRLMLAAAPETMAFQDTDEWWRERRVLARKLLDLGKFQDAYDVVRNAALPAMENYRADFHFMSGWIALRYLNDPLAARAHFAGVDEGSANPIVQARANYWRGRAAEALGEKDAMRTSYEAAARHPTAYYGQLARAKLGLDRLELRGPIPTDPATDAALADERVRAADMLYEIGERDTVVSFVVDLAEDSADVKALAALGELTGRRNHARAMLELGKNTLARGLALDHFAFPTIGIPQHTPIAPDVEQSVIYSVARTESAFDQRDKSAANAVGLMQVTPEAARDTAKRFGVAYSWERMVSDPVYNTQMGAAELSALLKEYKGSHIMTFAGYNAGRGRVRDWIKAHGDPRDPSVDAVDWVERIPFSETRNYVQRVMENLLVYRVRFKAGAVLAGKSDANPSVAQEVNAAPLPAQ
jgi:soluble lytic murein transglycosylase